MVMVVAADRVDPNPIFGKLGADSGHETNCFEAGVDIEGDHLAWECVFDVASISRVLSGDYCGAFCFSKGHLDLKRWRWELQTWDGDEYEGFGAHCQLESGNQCREIGFTRRSGLCIHLCKEMLMKETGEAWREILNPVASQVILD